MNKRGMSQIVTTIILILLILVVIGGIWAIVNNFILKNSGKINSDSFTLSLTLRSAKINYTTGLAEVRVRRNVGEGNLVGIKFIVEDKRNSDIFEERFDNFPELAERTFMLNLSTSSILNLVEVHKISIAPIFSLGTNEVGISPGKDQIGSIAGSIGGLNSNLNLTIIKEDNLPPTCEFDSDCPSDYFIPETKTCDSTNTKIMQYKKDYFCATGGISYCDSTNVQVALEICPSGTVCYDGICKEDLQQCSQESDCGIDGWTGILSCHSTQNATVQNYKDYSCVNSVCQVDVSQRIRKTCEVGEICFNGECFIPLECTTNNDCDFGEVCKDGKCIQETPILVGTIRSVWPFGIGEYFDSYDLPKEEQSVISGNYLIFPGSNENRCLQIQTFYAPDFEGSISYIRLSEPKSNLSDANQFQIWETNYGCSLI